MSVRISTCDPLVFIYDSTDGSAIGAGFDSEDDARDFLQYLANRRVDPQKLDSSAVDQHRYEWAMSR